MSHGSWRGSPSDSLSLEDFQLVRYLLKIKNCFRQKMITLMREKISDGIMESWTDAQTDVKFEIVFSITFS